MATPPAHQAPAGHTWHTAAPWAEKKPGLQGRQSAGDVALVPGEKVPAGQGTQRSAAEASKKAPALQDTPPPPLRRKQERAPGSDT